MRFLRDIPGPQVELQSHGFVKRFHGLPRVPHGAPITECASHELLVGTPGGMISPHVPPSGSAQVPGVVDVEARSVESVKTILKHPAPIAFGGGVGFGIGGRRGMPALGGVRGSNR